MTFWQVSTYNIAGRVGVGDINLVVGRLFAWNLDWISARAHWFLWVLMFDAFDFDADVDDSTTFGQESRAPFLIFAAVIGDLEVNMVEQIVGALFVELRL